jgi:hypothetical protein
MRIDFSFSGCTLPRTMRNQFGDVNMPGFSEVGFPGFGEIQIPAFGEIPGVPVTFRSRRSVVTCRFPESAKFPAVASLVKLAFGA